MEQDKLRAAVCLPWRRTLRGVAPCKAVSCFPLRQGKDLNKAGVLRYEHVHVTSSVRQGPWCMYISCMSQSAC